jgi:hypothetical protein
MDGATYRDAEFLNEVAEDVLGVLRKSRFFGRLEDRFCAPQSPAIPLKCSHSFALSIQVLRELGMDAQDIGDVLAVFRHRGACCDCEVLHNVADRSRLKMSYWNPKPADGLLNGHNASPYIN